MNCPDRQRIKLLGKLLCWQGCEKASLAKKSLWLCMLCGILWGHSGITYQNRKCAYHSTYQMHFRDLPEICLKDVFSRILMSVSFAIVGKKGKNGNHQNVSEWINKFWYIKEDHVVLAGWLAHLVGALSCTLNGCGFNSRLGHMQELTNRCFSLSISFSLSLLSPRLLLINEYILGWELKRIPCIPVGLYLLPTMDHRCLQYLNMWTKRAEQGK